MHGSAGWQRQPPQAHSPRQAGLAAPEPGWHPRVGRRNFPLGKAVCIFALIRLQRNAKGAREMKHILSQPDGQINTGKKARVSDQMNSDQNSGFKMKIGRVLKSWVASQLVQRAADPQLQGFAPQPQHQCGCAATPGQRGCSSHPSQGRRATEALGSQLLLPLRGFNIFFCRVVDVFCRKIFDNFWYLF